jgi:glutamate racemase
MNSLAQQHLPMPSTDVQAPIGIFDSGIGGLSIALEVLKHLPHERVLYYADTAHVPYGARDDAEICQLTAQAIDWLYRQGCKVAIVACNTASAFSLDYLRSRYGQSFAIIGLVPAVKPAVIQSVSKVVGVLATPATLRGQLLRDVIAHFAQPAGVQVLMVSNLQLVPLIEQGLAMSTACLALLEQLLDPLLAAGADHLVLGCTHYPFLRPAIQQLYPQRLSLVDSGLAVARQSGRILAKQNLLAAHSLDRTQLLCVFSGNNSQEMQPILELMLGPRPDWRLVDLCKY